MYRPEAHVFRLAGSSCSRGFCTAKRNQGSTTPCRDLSRRSDFREIRGLLNAGHTPVTSKDASITHSVIRPKRTEQDIKQLRLIHLVLPFRTLALRQPTREKAQGHSDRLSVTLGEKKTALFQGCGFPSKTAAGLGKRSIWPALFQAMSGLSTRQGSSCR